jgi:long-chain acyl-CoA synthetase
MEFPMNIARNVEQACHYFPDKPALIFEEQITTFEQLNEQINSLANGFKALGLEKGDRIALFLPNIPAFVISYYAAQKLGAIAVSINSMSKQREVKYIVNDSACKLLVTTAELREFVLTGELPSLKNVIIAEGEAENDIDMYWLMARGQTSLCSLDMHPDDPAVILYTSGTTGFPKGAVLTQRNIFSNSASAGNCSQVTDKDRSLLFLPLFHCFGQNYIMNAAFNKCATIVLHRRFEPEPVLDTMARHHVTIIFAVPTVYIHYINMDTSKYDLSSLRYSFTAASVMPRETSLQWHDKFGMWPHEGYGLTESSPFATYNHCFRHKHGSVGTPIENVDVKIVDDEGNDLPPGEKGEIVIRGPNVMKGYWGKPEATEQAFFPNGWLRSGDIGRTDDEGYFFIEDRVKDMIKAAGFNVYPSEVEQVLYQHPAIKETAVYGAADPIRGETVHASVILKDGMTATEEGIIEYCRKNMAVFKVPRKVIFCCELPKSATGKILKRILREGNGASQ